MKLNLGIINADTTDHDVDYLQLIEIIESLKDVEGVFLISFGENPAYDEVFITENIGFLLNICAAHLNNEKEVTLHRYNSFEDAYMVAINMKEPNPLCYE